MCVCVCVCVCVANSVCICWRLPVGCGAVTALFLLVLLWVLMLCDSRQNLCEDLPRLVGLLLQPLQHLLLLLTDTQSEGNAGRGTRWQTMVSVAAEEKALKTKAGR